MIRCWAFLLVLLAGCTYLEVEVLHSPDKGKLIT